MAVSISTSSLLRGLLAIILLSLFSLPAPVTGVCTDEVVSFSACLPYSGAPPNNFSPSPSTDCCGSYSQIVVAGNGFCLCYLLREPPILGFPLNSTKIFSLSSVCPPPQRNDSSSKNFSLRSVCSDLEALPPLQSSDPATSPSPSPMTQSTPISAGSSPPGFSPGSSQASSATRIRSSCSWFLNQP